MLSRAFPLGDRRFRHTGASDCVRRQLVTCVYAQPCFALGDQRLRHTGAFGLCPPPARYLRLSSAGRFRSATGGFAIPALQTKSLEKIKTILKYVEEHYDEHITIDDMAALTFYSKSHFMKFFKAHMGTGFIEYLNDYRLTIAERLLRTSDASVLEIAEKSGFDNLSYFNRIFKRKYGQSPGKQRRLYASSD